MMALSQIRSSKPGSDTDIVADLAGGHAEADRAITGIRNGMKRSVHAALCAPDQARDSTQLA